MKKTLSIVLAVLMALTCLVPAFAAEGSAAVPQDSTGGKTYKVTFIPPSAEFEGGYMFVKSVNGEIQYQPDPDGDYVFFDGRYMLPSNIIDPENVPEERFSPVQWDAVSDIAEGETLAFRVVTSEKYNILTAAVFVNGKNIYANTNEEYTVYVDRDLTINIAEKDPETGEDALLRNHFNVKLTSGDGYKVKTLKGANYNVVYYGESFDFRVQMSSGYSAAGMTVAVQRGNSVLNDYIGDDFDSLGNLMGTNEVLTSYGVDEDGCRLYRIENITTDCKIVISGVQEEDSVGIMAMLKRILRLILSFLGIELDILDSITAYYTVTIDSVADGVTYEVIRSSTDEITPREFNVTSGEGVTIIVTKKSLDQDVTVKWVPGNEYATYQTNWVLNYDTLTGEVSYSAVYNVDNITADTQIIIS